MGTDETRSLEAALAKKDRENVAGTPNALTALAKVNDALEECRKKGKRPACILCRPEFYVTLAAESAALSTPEVCLGVQTEDGAKTVFGVRLAVTADVQDRIRLFEIIV